MVGLTIGLLLTVGLMTMIAGTSRTFQIQDDFARMQENGALALNYLGSDIRMAGFYGMATTTTGITDPVGIAIANDCGSAANPPAANWAIDTTRPVFGFSGLTAATVSGTFPCIAGTNFLDQSPQAAQILVIRRANGYVITPATLTTQTNYLTTIYIQSEPARGAVFKGNDLAAVGAAVGPMQIEDPANPGNPIAARIFEYLARVYYIRPCSRPAAGPPPNLNCTGAADDAGHPIPTLVRQELNVGPGPLFQPTMVEALVAEGIERISFLYGIDDTPAAPNGFANGTGDGVPDRFTATPTTPADWANVVAVRVAVLARSPTLISGYDDSGKTYDLGGTDAAVPTFTCTPNVNCNYKRKVFVQTFQTRNMAMRRGA